MVQAVGNHGICGSKKRLKQPSVRVETGGKQDAVLFAQKPRQPLFQLTVNVLRTTDKPDRGHAVTVIIIGLFRRSDQIGVIGQPQIIVGTEVHDIFALLSLPAHIDASGLSRGDGALMLHKPVHFHLRQLV